MIQRGYIVLIIGGALFVAGIIIAAAWAVPLASMFLQENTLISRVSIEPGQSLESTTQVTDVSRPVSVAIHVERPGEQSADQDDAAQQQQQQEVPEVQQGVLRLIETVKDPAGTVVSSNEFSSNLFTTFQPEITGNYVLNITNAGTRPVTIDATFGYMPFITAAAPTPLEGGQQRLPVIDLSSLSLVIAGGVLTSIGFLTIFAGIVIVVIDSRKRGRGQSEDGSSSVTEGGITYRKD